jgi:multiple sugar transport system permease protein
MQAATTNQNSARKNSNRNGPQKSPSRLDLVLYTLLVISSILLMLPLVSLVLTSFKTFGESVGPFKWLPAQFNLENYREVFKLRDFNYWNYLGNTMLIFVLKTLGTLVSCTLAAYGYVRFEYKYKNIFFALLLTVIMLPGELLTIPMYEVYLKLGWYDTYYPLYLATYFGTDVFMIFLFRQFFISIPKELFEAAQIDGASEFQMYSRIMVPLSRPAIITCVLLYFTGTYNDIYTPLLYISSPQKYTMAQGLRAIEGIFNNGSRDYIVPWNLVSAATVLSLIPVLLVFVIAQRQFMEGVSRTGIKG